MPTQGPYTPKIQGIQDFLSRLHGVKETGGGFIARCPAHDDMQQSLGVTEGRDGRILLNCFAGCTAADVVAALDLELRDLFAGGGFAGDRSPWEEQPLKSTSRKPAQPSPQPQPAQPQPAPTIATLAADKGLPAEFLSQFTEEFAFGVKIIYKLSNGQLAPRQRLRVALSAKDGSRWSKGDGTPILYGSWRNDEMAETSNSILFVEGESDAWTAWYHNIAALGVPGADMAKKLQKQHVKPYSKVFLWREPDKGGVTFIDGMTRRLAEIEYQGEVFVIQGPPDPDTNNKPVKDLNLLHKKTMLNSGLFQELWQAILAAAEPIDLTSVAATLAEAATVNNSKRGLLENALNGQHIYKDFTDEGDADRFVELHGNDVLFCGDWNKWLIWTGKRWERDRTEEIFRKAASVSQAVLKEAAAESDRDRQDALIDHAKRLRSRAKIKTLVEAAESRVPAVPEQFDKDKFLLNVENGTLNLKTGELQPHRREDYLLKLAPVTYSPDAKAPVWNAFLRRVTNNDEDLMAFLQRAAGYALTGSTSEHCLFFLHGDGRNGKSVFIEALKYAIGDYAKSARPDILMAKRQGDAIPNEIAALVGVRFVATSESESGKKFAEAMLKQATGGDTISARFLRAEFFEFEPQFKIFLASNHKPIIRGQDTAIWERIYLIPFTVYIPPEERDKQLGEKLRAEAAGILRWAVEGCIQWQQGGLKPPAVVRAATEGYKTEMDALAEFLADRCIIQGNAMVSNTLLWSEYMDWCKESGEKYPLSRRDFKANLAKKNIFQQKSGIRFWKGVGLQKETRDRQEIMMLDADEPSNDAGLTGAGENVDVKKNGIFEEDFY